MTAFNFEMKTLYAGSIKFNILLGATKPAEEVTQEELEKACREGKGQNPQPNELEYLIQMI